MQTQTPPFKKILSIVMTVLVLVAGYVLLLRLRDNSQRLYIGDPVATNVQFPSQLRDNRYLLFWTGTAVAELDTTTGVTTSRSDEYSVPAATRVRWSPDLSTTFVGTEKPIGNDYISKASPDAPERFWWRINLKDKSITPVFCAGDTPPFDIAWSPDKKLTYLCPSNSNPAQPSDAQIVSTENTNDTVEIVGSSSSGLIIRKGSNIYSSVDGQLQPILSNVSDPGFDGAQLYAITNPDAKNRTNVVRSTQPYKASRTVWKSPERPRVIESSTNQTLLSRAITTKNQDPTRAISRVELEILEANKPTKRFAVVDGAEKISSVTFFAAGDNILVLSNSRHEAMIARTSGPTSDNTNTGAPLVAFDSSEPILLINNQGSMSYRLDTNELNIYLVTTPDNKAAWQAATAAALNTIRARGVDPNLVNKHYFGLSTISD